MFLSRQLKFNGKYDFIKGYPFGDYVITYVLDSHSVSVETPLRKPTKNGYVVSSGIVFHDIPAVDLKDEYELFVLIAIPNPQKDMYIEYKNTLNTCASGCMLTMNVNHNFNLLANSMLKIIYYKDEYKNLKQNLQSTLPLFINDARKFLIHNVGV